MTVACMWLVSTLNAGLNGLADIRCTHKFVIHYASTYATNAVLGKWQPQRNITL